MSAFVADLARHGRSRARRFGGPKPKNRDMLKISKSSQRIEYTAWRCREIQGDTGRIIGNSRWVGIFCAKDVVHFVRVMPPPPPVFVLPVPAWALMSVICCRRRFFALKQLLARLASILCNRRLSELRVQLLTLPLSHFCWQIYCRYICSKQGLNLDIYIANRG